MKCPECGMMLPEDSEFCQYCGTKIEHEQIKDERPSSTENKDKCCPNCGSDVLFDSFFCPTCGEAMSKQPNPAATGQTIPPKKRKKLWIVLVLVVLFVLIAACGTYLGTYLAARNKAQDGDCRDAQKLLFLPSLTEMHDPSLVLFLSAWDDLYSGKTSGYETILSLSKNHYRIAEMRLEDANNLAYERAVSSYHSGGLYDVYVAKKFFTALGSYKKSRDYITLIEAKDYDAVMKLIGFEDAEEVFRAHFFDQYLFGSWKTSDGQYYFEITDNGDGKHARYNLPHNDLEHSYYKIENGVYYLYDQDTSWMSIAAGNSEKKKKLFRFSFIDQDTASVYCYKNGSTFTLYRQ